MNVSTSGTMNPLINPLSQLEQYNEPVDQSGTMNDESSIPTSRAIKSMNPLIGEKEEDVDPYITPYNVDPYILDPTKIDMIQNSDIEENRQEVVDLITVSMHAMLMTTYRWKIKKL